MQAELHQEVIKIIIHLFGNTELKIQAEHHGELNENGIHLKQSEILGTTAFIAREIWKNVTHSKPGDVYTFGFLVYEMITLDISFNELNNT